MSHTMSAFMQEYRFRYLNRKFYLVFYHALEDATQREYYKSMHADIMLGTSPKQLYVRYKVSYESMFYLCKYLRTNVLDW
jgi:hypothetical protein